MHRLSALTYTQLFPYDIMARRELCSKNGDISDFAENLANKEMEIDQSFNRNKVRRSQ